MRATVYKIHSDFYYVKNLKHNSLVCKVRELLKKQKTDIIVGDFVEIDTESNTIEKRYDRKNFIPHPKCANIDLCLIVAPLKEPELDFIQLNRYLTFLKYHNIEALICFNKEDLLDDNSLETVKNKIENVYQALGYKMFFISAKTKLDLDYLSNELKNKTIALCGQSGAGKTTLLNAFNSEILSKTNEVSQRTLRGRHTTRHVEIFSCNDFDIIDTPGFSRLKFDFLLPDELLELFDDIKIYKGGCKFANCLHNIENNETCAVYKNIDKIDEFRYKSYLAFLNEALEYKKEISKKSIKFEGHLKTTGDKTVTRISKGKRISSRNTDKQKIKKEHQ